MNWLQKCDRDASALPHEKRQEFLALMWSGECLGDAAKKAGITFDEANGIMAQNITSTLTLNRIAR